MQQTFDVYGYNFPKCDIQNMDLKEIAFKQTKKYCRFQNCYITSRSLIIVTEMYNGRKL
jgi:hypothetical protein